VIAMIQAASTAAGGKRTRPSVALADDFRRYGEAYRRANYPPLAHRKVIGAVESCRTALLGGHREWCDDCGFERYAYNSCRNRHCPKCQCLARARWLTARKEELLPVPYFHNVFTLPHELNPLILCNMKPLLDLLFRAAADTLLDFGRNNLGGRIAFTMVLHTWDQTLGAHFHLHAVVTGGALAEGGDRWIGADSNFLFPVKALSPVFRAKFMEGFKKIHDRGKLLFPGQAATFRDPRAFKRLCNTLWSKRWVLYSKKPFAGPEQVLDYLGRYTHRVAISNDRLLAVDHGKVCFRYRDRARGDVCKTMTVEADEFIRRFLLHVLPHGYVRIRHFGLLANRHKGEYLARCRQLLAVAAPAEPTQDKSVAEWLLHLTGHDITRCPQCGHAPLQRVEIKPLRTLRWNHGRSPPISEAA